MSLAAALVLLSQTSAATPIAITDAPRRQAPIATATARVRVLRPASLRVDAETGNVELVVPSRGDVQRSMDVAGTAWIEFS